MSFLNFHQVKCLHARFLLSNEVMQWQENRRKPDVLYFKDIEWHYRILNRDHACVQSSLECRILSSYVELEGNRFVGILHRLSQLLCSRPRGVASCGIPASSNTMTINDYITHHYTIIHNELIQCNTYYIVSKYSCTVVLLFVLDIYILCAIMHSTNDKSQNSTPGGFSAYRSMGRCQAMMARSETDKKREVWISLYRSDLLNTTV